MLAERFLSPLPSHKPKVGYTGHICVRVCVYVSHLSHAELQSRIQQAHMCLISADFFFSSVPRRKLCNGSQVTLRSRLAARAAVPSNVDIALTLDICIQQSLSTSEPLSRQYRPRLHAPDAFPALPLFY